MKLFTINSKRRNILHKLSVPLLDVTTNGGIPDITPNASDIFLRKIGTIHDEEFIRRYREKLVKHLKANPKFWADLARVPMLGIYCERRDCDDLSNRRHIRDMIVIARKEMHGTIDVAGMEIDNADIAFHVIARRLLNLPEGISKDVNC